MKTRQIDKGTSVLRLSVPPKYNSPAGVVMCTRQHHARSQDRPRRFLERCGYHHTHGQAPLETFKPLEVQNVSGTFTATTTCRHVRDSGA